MAFPLRTRTRGRPGRNAGVTNVAATPAFNPLTSWTTAPIHGVWASDPAWTPPADGGAVSSWRNGGSVGGDFVQETGAKQPTYDAALAAYNNAAVVTFDGTDDVLFRDIADVAQPFYLLLVGDTAGGTGAENLLGIGANEAATTGSGLGDTITGVWNIRAGGPDRPGGTTDTNPHLFRATYNGASSLLSVDGAATATGNTGTDPATVLALGAAASAVPAYSRYLNGSIAYMALFTTDPSGQAEWATFKAWVTSTYGIAVA